MPLSDNLRYFLQHVGMTPEQQAQERQQQAMAARMSDQFAQTQAYNQQKLKADQEEAFLRAQTSLVPYGYNMQRGQGGAGGPATQGGGPGLNATEPTIAEAPGQPTPRGAGPSQPSTDEIMEKLMPGFGQFQGQQQQGGMGVNQPGQMPQGGPMQPGMRMPGMSGDSGGGGAAQPAASKPIMPTMQSVLQGQFGGQPYNVSRIPEAPGESFDIPTPKELQSQGWPAKVSIPKDHPEKAAAYLQAFEKFNAPPKPEKLTDSERQMRSAAKDTATNNKLDESKFTHPDDFETPALRAEAWSNFNNSRMSDLDKQIKQERVQAQKDKEQEFAEARTSDAAAMNMVKRDPMYFNHKNVPDQKQYQRLQTAAEAQGVRLPTQELTPDLKKNVNTADEIQIQTKRIQDLAQQVGWQNFGAIVGRMKQIEGKLGEPIITIDRPSKQGTPQAQLEAELRDHLNLLTAQEAKLLGGGRTAVMLFNIVKNSSPQQYMSQPIFQGALNATYNRAQVSKNVAKRYAFGDTDEASAMQGMAMGSVPREHFVGERLYHPKEGKYYTVKEVLPGNKIRTEE